MKVISFSLWGTDLKYLIGAIRNAELALEIYPGWECWYYVGTSVPYPIINKLTEHDHVKIIRKHNFGDWTSMLWRFEPAADPNVEVMISRDTDSRLNMREKSAVDEWLESDKGFHIMRDHPYHKFPVLGGMWGAKKDTIPDMIELTYNWGGDNTYGTDYGFFAHSILPTLSEDNIMIHDEFFDKKPFPTKRENFEFVGQIFDEKEKTVRQHVETLKVYLIKI